MSQRFNYFLAIIIPYLIFACSEIMNEDPEPKSSQATVVINGNIKMDTAWIRLVAELFYQYDSYEEAAEEYEKLANYDPLNGKFYFKRAYCLFQTGRYEASSSSYLKAAELGYEEAECYFALAEMYSLIGEDDSLAIKFAKKSLLADPTLKRAKRLLTSLKK
jgi:tetratricopeptide (TPR) repeat protein